jgi:hypothetical protein
MTRACLVGLLTTFSHPRCHWLVGPGHQVRRPCVNGHTKSAAQLPQVRQLPLADFPADPDAGPWARPPAACACYPLTRRAESSAANSPTSPPMADARRGNWWGSLQTGSPYSLGYKRSTTVTLFASACTDILCPNAVDCPLKSRLHLGTTPRRGQWCRAVTSVGVRTVEASLARAECSHGSDRPWRWRLKRESLAGVGDTPWRRTSSWSGLSATQIPVRNPPSHSS